ncbi:MAG TPA: C39 family peptidase [Candidatus Dormibacteraeota bacterium]|nr:C39 family peptidase [Candidatus Dormibacteraeota bacterium]
MAGPFSDYAYMRARARRRPAAGRRVVVVALVVAIVALGYGGYRGARFAWHRLHAQGSTSSHAVSQGQLGKLTQVTPNITREPAVAAAESPSPAPPPPAGAILTVPYTVQAPNGNWKVFENACEEASALMYHDFLEGDGRAQLPPAEVDLQLRAMEGWQVINWGADRDLTLERTGQFAQAYWGYHYQVITLTEQSVREAIAAGHPVIIPVMTHSLQNPHYGPHTVYHELLIKGYTSTGAVTNDPGVQEGKDWFYSWPILFGAVDAQTPRMSQGRVGLILTK